MKRKNSIDLFRFICAFYVLIGHSRFGDLPTVISDHIILTARWVLPFFYMSTGYFMHRKVHGNNKFEFSAIEKNITHLTSMLIIASIVFLPLGSGVIKQPGVAHLLNGSHYHLWFIGSMIAGYLFIWYIYQIGMSKLLPVFSAGILILALLYDSYDRFFNLDLGFDLFRLLLSIPFMYIGLCLGKQKLEKKHRPMLFVTLVLGICMLLFEGTLFWNMFNYPKSEHQFLFGSFVTGVSLFSLLLLTDIKDNKLSEWGRKYTLFIYLYHPWVYVIMPGVIKRIVPSDLIGTVSMFNPVICLVLMLLISYLLERFLNPVFNILNGNIADGALLNKQTRPQGPHAEKVNTSTVLPVMIEKAPMLTKDA